MCILNNAIMSNAARKTILRMRIFTKFFKIQFLYCSTYNITYYITAAKKNSIQMQFGSHPFHSLTRGYHIQRQMGGSSCLSSQFLFYLKSRLYSQLVRNDPLNLLASRHHTFINHPSLASISQQAMFCKSHFLSCQYILQTADYDYHIAKCIRKSELIAIHQFPHQLLSAQPDVTKLGRQQLTWKLMDGY